MSPRAAAAAFAASTTIGTRTWFIRCSAPNAAESSSHQRRASFENFDTSSGLWVDVDAARRAIAGVREAFAAMRMAVSIKNRAAEPKAWKESRA